MGDRLRSLVARTARGGGGLRSTTESYETTQSRTRDPSLNRPVRGRFGFPPHPASTTALRRLWKRGVATLKEEVPVQHNLHRYREPLYTP